jgi:tetratricopeptide (TPR) repeat protein
VFALYSARRLPEALSAVQGLLSTYPDAPLLLNILGAIHAGLGDLDAAADSYRRALRLRPDVADTHFHLGNVLAVKGDRAGALAAFDKAVELRPDYVEAHANRCRELERANRIDELRTALADAGSHCPPEHPALQLWRAELARRDGDFDAARRVLEVPATAPADADTEEARSYLLAEVYDRLGEPQAAYRAALAANKLCAASEAARRIDGAAYRRQIALLTETFTPQWVDRWLPAPVTDTYADPVFLVGFPRSGTTLLDTLLRSHPRVIVVEEKPMVRVLEQAVSKLPGGYPGALADLDAAALADLRSAYFAELARHTGPVVSGQLVVDKLPFNLAHAGLLQRVFPRSRFLLALRHPCDAVLSAYLRSFELNEAMVNFLDLEAAAGLYAEVMTLWRRYCEVLPLSVHEIRYEELVAAVRPTLTPLLEFLGLDWHDALAAHDETARARGDMQTPSYHQVVEPVYTRASGRWQGYREALAPVLPVLEPWLAEWGYPPAAQGGD